ncbi:MAG: cell division protein FtsA [Tannerellaceae bacterium]|jgi:cell division protein FtsA|nr:cell division protein FtsA [Tannerellaceae bacterium]
MAYTDFIAALYLGTSRITGIVGKKEAGLITVIAYETENSANCIHRGCVYNVKETANKAKEIIRRLEAKSPGSRIGKVYIGVGGQSIRSVKHSVSKSFETECMITDELKDSLLDDCKTYQPEGLDVLSVIPSTYDLDKRPALDPVGISCSLIEANYQLIVARPSIRKRIEEMGKLAKIEIAGILPSPLVLADVVLSEDEKKRGCALIDFGAGVTSLSLYKNGCLLGLWVIPLGGNLITKDLADYLGIRETAVERLKRDYGNAIVNKDELTTFQVDVEPAERATVRLADFNTVIEARMQEILENVYDRLETVGLKELRAGIVITGKTANLENLTTLIYNRLKPDIQDVRYACIREDLVIKAKQSNLEPDGITLGLLLEGKINCVEQTLPPIAPPLVQTPIVQTPPPAAAPPPTPPPAEEKAQPESSGRTPKKQKGRIGNKVSGFLGDLFKEQ